MDLSICYLQWAFWMDLLFRVLRELNGTNIVRLFLVNDIFDFLLFL